MTNQTRNTLLRLHGCQEWICNNGYEYHLTAERGNATPFTKAEVSELKPVFEEKFNHPLDTEDWIIENWKSSNQESIEDSATRDHTNQNQNTEL